VTKKKPRQCQPPQECDDGVGQEAEEAAVVSSEGVADDGHRLGGRLPIIVLVDVDASVDDLLLGPAPERGRGRWSGRHRGKQSMRCCLKGAGVSRGRSVGYCTASGSVVEAAWDAGRDGMVGDGSEEDVHGELQGAPSPPTSHRALLRVAAHMRVLVIPWRWEEMGSMCNTRS
jgi:hypothetical protein